MDKGAILQKYGGREQTAARARAAEAFENGSSHQVAAAPINVFAHLAWSLDATEWRRALEAGTLVGINNETPYGYGLAEYMGCRVTFSRSFPEGPLAKFVRLGIRAVTGFDYLHALRQGDALAAADVVWTHTESQYLAVSAALMSKSRRPKLLGQSVWLFDRWKKLGPLYRALYRRLIAQVDVLTFLSEENLAIARAAFPQKRVEFVLFGMTLQGRKDPAPRIGTPIRILALGNDRDRDWKTLIDAVKGCEQASLLILSGSVPARLARGVRNVQIKRAKTKAELVRHFAEATLVCIPLKPNSHASGITAVLEAVLVGAPVVVSEAGGLTSYFSRDQVRYVPPGDVNALREALLAVGNDPNTSHDMAVRAQARLTGSLTSEAYVRRHVELSRELLRR